MAAATKKLFGTLLFGAGVGYYLKGLFVGPLVFINNWVGVILIVVGVVLYLQSH